MIIIKMPQFCSELAHIQVIFSTHEITLRPYLTFIVATDHSVLAVWQEYQLALFGYAQTALNADAMFEFCLHEFDKVLLLTIILCMPQKCHDPSCAV